MLKNYLYRLYGAIVSRGNIEVERLVFDDQKQRASIEGRLRFYEKSLLAFDEVVLLRDNQIVKLRYAYHYQKADGELIFRYDNAPHFPKIPTYPHHKHTDRKKVEAAQPPDINEVLNEIEQILYEPE
ncbi:MAG TPA: hypothetical protein DCM38_05295 [Gammaproteobacteria bacterium]|nr:hypothetical protein [Gammaproteobacteria bacterium]